MRVREIISVPNWEESSRPSNPASSVILKLSTQSLTDFPMVAITTLPALISTLTSKPKKLLMQPTETIRNGPKWPSRVSPSLANSPQIEPSLSTAMRFGILSPFQSHILLPTHKQEPDPLLTSPNSTETLMLILGQLLRL